MHNTVSATRMMYAEESLASRILVLGGAPPSVRPLASPVAESTYRTVINALGYRDMSSEERVKALRNVSISDLQKTLNPGMPFVPIMDGSHVPYNESFSFMASQDYVFKAKPCEAAMVVFSPLDVSAPR